MIRPLSVVACLAPLLLLACSSSSRVSSQPKDVLKNYRKVAVASMEITVLRQKAEKSETGNRLAKYIALADEYIYKAFREAFGDDVRIGSSRPSGRKDPTETLEDLAIEIANRNLLRKGFLPVERKQIKLIMRELSRSRTGLYDPATRKEIGRLANVDSIFHGRILVGVEEGLFSLKTRVTFNGRIVSVEEGFVLISGESSYRDDEFKPSQIRNVLDGWFERVPRL